MTTEDPRAPGDDDTAIHVGSAEEFEEHLATDDPILIDFYADWCGPCQMMADTVDEIAAETDTTVLKVDVDELPGIAAEYEVRSIPAFVAVEHGETTDRLVGMQEKVDLRRAVEA